MRATLRLLPVFVLVAGCRPLDVHFDDRSPRLRIQTMWQAQLDTLEPVPYYPKQTAAPAYADRGRLVIAGSEGGVVVGADARSGQVKWRFDTGGKVRSGATVHDDSVYIGNADGRLYCLEAETGTEVWLEPYATRGAITSSPTLAQGRLFFQTDRGRTFAVDAQTGKYLWDQGRARPNFLTIQGEGGAAVSGEHVFAGYDDGYLVSMRASDGATVWARSLAGDATEFVDVDTRPVIRGDVVYASSFATGLYAVDKKHGAIRWIHKARGVRTPALGDELLYLVDGSGRARALDPATGKVAWEARFDYGELSEPIVSFDQLWIPTGSGLVLMDGPRGIVQARISPDYGQTAPVALRNGWVHMVTNSGALVGARVL